MEPTLPARAPWRPLPSSHSRYVRFAALVGCSQSQARHKLPASLTNAKLAVRAMKQAGQTADACAFLAELEAELEEAAPEFREAVTLETAGDTTEDKVQMDYHLDPTDENARTLLQHWGRVLRTTTHAIAALRLRHPDA